MATRSAASKTLAVLAVVAALGAGAIAAWTARGDATRGFDTLPWQRAAESRLREAAAALHARVATLADLPRLAAAVSTDAQTVRDLTQDELAFRPRAGETIAIGQLPKRGAPVVLLAFPDQARAPEIYPLGPRAWITQRTAGSEGGLRLSEAVRVVPRARADELDGVVATSLGVNLDDLSKDLAAAGLSAEIVLGDRRLTLGAPTSVANVSTFDLPLAGSVGAGTALRLVLRAPAKPGEARYWGGAAALAAIALLLALRARRAALSISLPAKTPEIWAATPALPTAALRRTRRTTPAVTLGTSVRRIGRYEILQHIGTGGMADVFLAHCTGEAGFTKKIALKVLDPVLARQPRAVEHFLDEARLSSLLDHPNIVQILDLGRADDEYFIAMEHVDGADLARLIGVCHETKRPVPVAVVLAILRKICDGLYAAHTTQDADGTPLNLVHRDVKSGNVFVARNGVVKIGDFGIAMANHASRISRTDVGLVKGTPGYMAPEHRLGQTIDGRADLYGVGAIAYEMLAGIPVNLDLTVLALKGRDGWPHLAPLSRFRKDISPELEAVIFRALAYDVDDRFADCAALESVLEDLARRYPPIAGDKAIAQWIDKTLQAEAFGRPMAIDRTPMAPRSAGPANFEN